MDIVLQLNYAFKISKLFISNLSDVLLHDAICLLLSFNKVLRPSQNNCILSFWVLNLFTSLGRWLHSILIRDITLHDDQHFMFGWPTNPNKVHWGLRLRNKKNVKRMKGCEYFFYVLFLVLLLSEFQSSLLIKHVLVMQFFCLFFILVFSILAEGAFMVKNNIIVPLHPMT